MTEPSPPKSPLGPMLLIVILLLDVGLLVWGWYIYQSRKPQYSGAGLDFSRPPTPSETPAPRALPTQADPSKDWDITKNIVQDEEGFDPSPSASVPGTPGAAGRPSAPRPAGAPGSIPSPSGQCRPQTREKVSRAASVFFALKKDPRFRDSKVIREWKRDFLTYPDLRAVNDQYRKDKDPIRFLVGMFRSPNFVAMVKKYAATPDAQDFLKAMASSEVVVGSAKDFFKDYNMEAAVRHLPIPGADKLGAPAQAPAPGPGIRDNPALKKYLERQDGAPAVRLGGG